MDISGFESFFRGRAYLQRGAQSQIFTVSKMKDISAEMGPRPLSLQSSL